MYVCEIRERGGVMALNGKNEMISVFKSYRNPKTEIRFDKVQRAIRDIFVIAIWKCLLSFDLSHRNQHLQESLIQKTKYQQASSNSVVGLVV